MERIGLVHVEDIADIERKESVSCILRVPQISNGNNGFGAYLGNHVYLMERMGWLNTEVTEDIKLKEFV